jgi:hypothetical protein
MTGIILAKRELNRSWSRLRRTLRVQRKTLRDFETFDRETKSSYHWWLSSRRRFRELCQSIAGPSATPAQLEAEQEAKRLKRENDSLRRKWDFLKNNFWKQFSYADEICEAFAQMIKGTPFEKEGQPFVRRFTKSRANIAKLVDNSDPLLILRPRDLWLRKDLVVPSSDAIIKNFIVA